ncbi:MAG: FHA domain-containing protein [Dehalococcoidia bacterium]|nr:FHA domain-containing protein [Dehalococcoidia bacterium]
MEEIIDVSVICPACQGLNGVGSFFCYSCGEYLAGEQECTGNSAVMEEAAEAAAQGAVARMIMPGGEEIILTDNPQFIQRSNFEGKLPQDALMSVSRQHLLVTRDNGTYFVQDHGRDGTGSTNHTRVNNIDIHHKGRQALRDGDSIELARQPGATLIFRLN